METFGVFLGGAVLVVFGYFIYKKVTAKKTASTGSGGGRPNDNSVPKQDSK